jgi:BirA family biotin operon repressor/biotin-[acetyl-CoA-carboxylase] ligase
MTVSAAPAWRVQRYECLASTQDLAIAAAKDGDPGRLAILADVQTAGRGSRGRTWEAPSGNLNFSALLRPEQRGNPGFWALLAGIALHDALAPFASGLMLKWPNDLLRDGAKLGGILIDASYGEALNFLVIGMGANLVAAPDIPGRRTTHLPPPAPDPAEIAKDLIRWLARAHPLGTELDIHTPHRRLKGPFAGLTETGALCIAGHTEPLSSAEVFVA